MEHDALIRFRQIIEGCRRKDRLSQNELYKMYYAYGMSICIRYVNNETEATSILNEGFLKVFQHLKKFDDNRAFKPWFRKIIVNTAINHLNRNKKYRSTLAMDAVNNLSSGEDVLSKISYKELLSMVRSLSHGYRTVFNMYVIDGFKHHEIAKQLGITVGTSKSNLSRARENLRSIVLEKMKNTIINDE